MVLTGHQQVPVTGVRITTIFTIGDIITLIIIRNWVLAVVIYHMADYPFYYGDDQFFYSQVYFTTYNDNQYTVVEPPVGAEVTSLPDKAQSIVINGQQYFEENGVITRQLQKTMVQLLTR